MKLYRAKRNDTPGHDEATEALVWAATAGDAREALETAKDSRVRDVKPSEWTVEAVRMPTGTTILLVQTLDG